MYSNHEELFTEILACLTFPEDKGHHDIFGAEIFVCLTSSARQIL